MPETETCRTAEEFPVTITLRFESEAQADAFTSNLLDGRGENMAGYYWHADLKARPGYWTREFWLDWVEGIDDEEDEDAEDPAG